MRDLGGEKGCDPSQGRGPHPFQAPALPHQCPARISVGRSLLDDDLSFDGLRHAARDAAEARS